MINSWTTEELLFVANLPNLNSELAIKIIEYSNNLLDFLDNKLIAQVSTIFKQESLFDAEFINYENKAKEIFYKTGKCAITPIFYWDYRYPALLKKIPFPPFVLYTLGTLQAAESEIISIVGTRRCSDYGKMCAEHFAEAFVNAGIVVASGLATGIDTYAHMVAVKKSAPTYAVLASGLDQISPQTSADNAKKIIDSGGALISAYPAGVKALPPYFLQRNRLISGLARAVLVVESAYKGGSLNTARNASEQNREVYAIPGRINSEKSKGCNMLIKKNIAQIAISPEDMLSDLGLIESDDNSLFSRASKPKVNLSPDSRKVFDCIGSEPINTDKIAELCGMEISDTLSILLILEFEDLIRQLPGKNYIRFEV
jgi:DNA processing protein